MLYCLLQSESAMLPFPREADELRQTMSAALLSDYTEDGWQRRVPKHMREMCTRARFNELYLTRPTAHVPHDCIALWQDLRRNDTDVYIVVQDDHGERVERVRCVNETAASWALMLLFTWGDRAGHYELLTYNDVVVLPSAHSFIRSMDELHEQYVAGFSRAVKRSKRTHAATDVDYDYID